MDDILPSLLQKVQDSFKKACSQDKELQGYQKLAENKKADYETAQNYSIRLGELLSEALTSNISADELPDGRMYYNIANRLFNEVLSDQHDEISDFCSQVQQTLNEAANIGVAVQTAELNQDRIDGIIEKVSNAENFDDVKWMLESPVVNYSQSVVDDSIKANAELQSKVGLQPKITRKAESGACKWCQALVGTFDYPEDVPDDFYRRHENCRCVVTYDPKDGRGVQDSHTKVWTKKDSKTIKSRIFENKQYSSYKLEQASPINGTIPTEKTSIIGPPNWVTEITPKKYPENVTRNYYDENGRLKKQITIGDHGNPKKHPHGEIGEHAHDIIYNEKGDIIDRPMRPLTEEERKENEDALTKAIKIRRDKSSNK